MYLLYLKKTGSPLKQEFLVVERMLYFWSMEHLALIFYWAGNSILEPMKENLTNRRMNCPGMLILMSDIAPTENNVLSS